MADASADTPAIDWLAAWAVLRDLDGDAWDTEHERLKAAWEAEYVRAFVGAATDRRGWTIENAEVWAGKLAADAFVFPARRDPTLAGTADVLECEKEAADHAE